MPRRETQLTAGCFYHLYNRGHNRKPIFFEAESYAFFLRRLRHYVVPSHAIVIAYVLMPNHYHFLIQAQSNDLSHAMQLFGISYTKAINTRFGRAGALFQGAFRAKLVDREEYLLELSRYIHLNPVRAGMVRYPEDWLYSSYRDYIGLRDGTLPQPELVLDYFPNRDGYCDFVRAYKPEDRERVAHLLFA